MAEQHLERGVSCVKVKTGLNPDSDIARFGRFGSRRRDIPLTIDSNCGWTLQQANHVPRGTADVNLLLAEQPILAGDPAALAELRRDAPRPIMADEGVSRCKMPGFLAHRAADILSVYPGKHGGIAATAGDHRVARRPDWLHDREQPRTRHRHRGDAARRRRISGSGYRHFPADTIGPFYHDGDCRREPLDLGPPYAHVPDGPGLGVELDEAATETLAGRLRRLSPITDSPAEHPRRRDGRASRPCCPSRRDRARRACVSPSRACRENELLVERGIGILHQFAQSEPETTDPRRAHSVRHRSDYCH